MRSWVDELFAGRSVESAAERLVSRALAPETTGAFVARCAEGPVGLWELPRLAAVDPSTLDGAGRVDLIRAFERVRAMVDGAQQRALGAVVDATEALGLDGEAARHEVGAALRLSPQTAWKRTRVAADLRGRLPDTLAALTAGDIGYWQAAHLADTLRGLPDDVAEAVQARVLPQAVEQTVAETRREVARAVAAADPAGAQDRHDRAVRQRSIERSPQPEAMDGWWVTMPAPAGQAAWEALTRSAKRRQARIRRERGIDPGLDALRVDVLVDAILGADRADRAAKDGADAGDDLNGADGPEPPGAGLGGWPLTRAVSVPPVPRCRCGGAQTAAVVVDLPTLLGLAERPGELPGYGPVPPGLARELAADRDWVRWVVDPMTRRLLDRGAQTYRPGDRLRRFLAAAYGRCGFPGCNRRADGCDTDHRVTFRRGGRTTVVNLGPLCRSHHNAKTHGRWRLTLDTTHGCLVWTSPLGKTYRKSIDPILE
jgi:hypothetical protein